MHRLTLIVLATALVGVGLSAPALAANNATPTTHYRWKDASGVVHFGDTIPSSALAGGYDIVNSQGMVVRHVSRELTPAERRAAAAIAARESAARREVQQRKVADAQMLAAYPTEHDLERSQQAQLHQIQTDIATLETNLRSQEDSLTELLAHAADIEQSGKPVPPYVHKRIADQRQTVNSERGTLAQRRTDLVNAKQQFAARLQHYRTLRAEFRSDDDPSQP
jgi:outer membrane PBP1 activator LpoA protein